MSYKSLIKIYYDGQDVYQEAYSKRFSSDNATHLDFDIAGHPAFFEQCSDVIDLTYQILALDKETYALRAKLPAVALNQYSRKCLIDEIVLTNNIEGVYSSRKEIGAALHILEQQSAGKGRKNVFLGLVNKYLKLSSREEVPLQTCQDIRNIYDEIVLQEVVSENRHNTPDGKIFRKDMTEVYSSTGKSIHRGKYPESEIIAYMEKALSFLNDERILPLHRICLFHYLLEYIHPFYDGNGRLGRFILSYCIASVNFASFESLLSYRISETIKENIKKYYDAFKTCNDGRNLADLTPFLIMMLEMIKTSMEELKKSLSEKLYSWDRYRRVIPMLEKNENKEIADLYDVLIQASLFSEQGISTQELLSVFSTNYVTMGKRLNIIKNQDLLITEKHENRKYYSIKLNDLNDILLKN